MSRALTFAVALLSCLVAAAAADETGGSTVSTGWTVFYYAMGIILVVGSFIFIATAQSTSDWCKARHRREREREAMSSASQVELQNMQDAEDEEDEDDGQGAHA